VVGYSLPSPTDTDRKSLLARSLTPGNKYFLVWYFDFDVL
jgi:hypothetical protein